MTPTWTAVRAAHGPALARVVASYAPPGPEREDLAQEVAAALIRAFRTFRAEASVRTFALRVAHNVCLRHTLRRRKQAGEPLHEVVDPRPSPEASAVRREQGERLMAAIRQLPVGLRQVLTLTLEDLPQREIGSLLGITENAVAIRMHRARRLLKGLLEAS